MLDERKGKTFEEIYGEEKAKKLKKLGSFRASGEKNPMYGKKMSEETKLKISNANSGEKTKITEKLSKEHLQKLIDFNTNRVVSKETRQKLRDIAQNRKFSKETKCQSILQRKVMVILKV